ncbi:uncharacterized protein E0L32_004306 [Thyridium curvatum]|uniref:Uncharacterized protein n=1 Tax=Thyridium curvatum TaxID=1093900 RepID=A0A507BFX4_9PEZI|nr:uncharacterized protein E0L32_004306 [Thyridium curvatum]TPX15608.1 hypothetical protein E0L32_004306 [Thyridium curvatum]
MCRTAYYRHQDCGCRWMRITRPCGPGQGFRTCPMFFNNNDTTSTTTTHACNSTPIAGAGPTSQALVLYRPRNAEPGPQMVTSHTVVVRENNDSARATLQPPMYRARETACPVHDLLGFYDRNQVRMVVRLRNGLRWGTGPNREDYGVEFWCCVIKETLQIRRRVTYVHLDFVLFLCCPFFRSRLGNHEPHRRELVLAGSQRLPSRMPAAHPLRALDHPVVRDVVRNDPDGAAILLPDSMANHPAHKLGGPAHRQHRHPPPRTPPHPPDELPEPPAHLDPAPAGARRPGPPQVPRRGQPAAEEPGPAHAVDGRVVEVAQPALEGDLVCDLGARVVRPVRGLAVGRVVGDVARQDVVPGGLEVDPARVALVLDTQGRDGGDGVAAGDRAVKVEDYVHSFCFSLAVLSDSLLEEEVMSCSNWSLAPAPLLSFASDCKAFSF